MANNDHANAAKGVLDATKDKARSAVNSAQDTLGKATEGSADAYGAARAHAEDGYDAMKSAINKAGARTAQTIDSYPVAAIAGGVALGIALGALLPRTEREAQALGPVGAKVGDAARRAFHVGVDAGKQSFADMGFSPDAAKGQAQKFVETIVAAIREAGSAAAKASQPQ